MIHYEPHRSTSTDYYIVQHDRDFNYPYHMHKSFEFVCVREGILITTISGRECRLSKNEAVLILPHEPHSYKTEEHSQSSIYIFSPEYVQDYYDHVKGYTFVDPVLSIDSERIVKQMDGVVGNVFLIKSILYYLCGICMEQCRLEKQKGHSRILPEYIINYITSNYDKPITLKSLSKELGYNYHYLSTYFHNSLHISFSDFLNGYRIEYAKKMLANMDWSITDISAEVGFNTIRSFNRTFLKFVNQTPGDYRKMLMNREDSGKAEEQKKG